MSLSASTVWEVRGSGSDTNGGGFVTGASGSDYSQQDAAQYSVTDGVTAGTTTITSATANFGTDVVGNIIYVAGGTGSVTADWYQITARGSATSITVDRSTGLTAGTGVTLKIGGALATVNRAVTEAVAENKVWVKNGTIACAAEIAPSVNLTIEGYNATRGDNPVGSNRPLIVAGGSFPNASIFRATSTNVRLVLANLRVDGDGQAVIGFQAYARLNSIVVNCGAIDCATAGFDGRCELCDATGCGNGFGTSGSLSGVCVGCVAADCTQGFANTEMTSHCIADGCTSGFIIDTSNGIFRAINCTAYACTDGFKTAQSRAFTAISCVAYGCGAYGFDLAAGAATALINCAGGSNTSGNKARDAFVDHGFIALSADPFTNAAAGDFSLNTTSGGGAALRAAGSLGLFPGGTTTGYLDVGAAQHADPAGGGGALLRATAMSGGLV